MSAYKIQHKGSKKFLSTTFVKHRCLFLDPPLYNILDSLVENGKVYSSKKAAEKMLKVANKILNEFELAELSVKTD